MQLNITGNNVKDITRHCAGIYSKFAKLENNI